MGGGYEYRSSRTNDADIPGLAGTRCAPATRLFRGDPVHHALRALDPDHRIWGARGRQRDENLVSSRNKRPATLSPGGSLNFGADQKAFAAKQLYLIALLGRLPS